jgi:hypothetical protein
LPSGSSPDGNGKRSTVGDEDFAGLRKYTPGDALPRIAWKAYARERGLQVKQFSTPLGEELWLDYADTPDRNEEQKLSRMTRWVLDAETQGLRYGLHLPDGDPPLRHGGAEPSGAGGVAGQLFPQSADFVSNVSQLPSGNGIAHRDECLRRIALFNLPQQNDPLPQLGDRLGRGKS